MTARKAAARIDDMRNPKDAEFLATAATEILRHSRLVVSSIMQIGRTLTEVKERIGHGRYQAFVRDRLHFSRTTARQFVQCYQMLKSANFADLESLKIDASALYVLARPTTPEEIRTKALAMARMPDGISHAEVIQLVAKSKDAAPPPQRQSTIRIPCDDVPQAARILTANCRAEMLRELIRLLDAQLRPEAAA
jgi:hypothetical protein